MDLFRHGFFTSWFRRRSANEPREAQLARKWLDGTITAKETQELDSLVPLYHQCPVCNGAFRSSDYDSSGCCSQCDTTLTMRFTEVSYHQLNEIIASEVVDEARFGKLCFSFAAPGMKYCEYCGITYPQRYSCCPGLIDAAIRFYRNDEATHGSQVIAFINTHSETLCNMLRGRFKIDQRSQRYFERRILPQLLRADEITRILQCSVY